jgi:hypothetical protein
MGQQQKNLKPFCFMNVHSFGGFFSKISKAKPCSLIATRQQLLERVVEH